MVGGISIALARDLLGAFGHSPTSGALPTVTGRLPMVPVACDGPIRYAIDGRLSSQSRRSKSPRRLPGISDRIGSAGGPGWCERYCRGAPGIDEDAIGHTAAEAVGTTTPGRSNCHDDNRTGRGPELLCATHRNRARGDAGPGTQSAQRCGHRCHDVGGTRRQRNDRLGRAVSEDDAVGRRRGCRRRRRGQDDRTTEAQEQGKRHQNSPPSQTICSERDPRAV